MKPGTQKLSEVKRHLIEPTGIVSTGWPPVRDTCQRLGWGFDRWQDGAGRLILAKDRDGMYAARDGVVLSLPRQVGKTYLIGAIIFALCLIFPGLTVIWTSHRVKVAKETFTSMAGRAAMQKVKPHIERVVRGRGDEAILFKNGSRIMFGARESGGGRGIAGVDILVFDEAQILTDRTLADMLAAQNVSANALTFYIGTPPRPIDPGDVFTRLRDEALSGDADGTLYIELGADKDFDVRLRDDRMWQQVARANPSYPHRTTARAVLRLIKRLTPGDAAHEVFGIWDETAHKPVITRPAWDNLEAKGLLPDVPASALGVDATGDGRFYAAGCWLDGDDAHVELLPLPGELNAMADLIAARLGRRIPVLIHSTSPAKPLVPLLTARKVLVKLTAGPDMATGCGLLVADMTGGRFTHRGQKPLTDAVMAGRLKPYGDAGASVWDFTIEGVPPLIAATLARLGASQNTRQKTGRATFA